MVSKTRCGFAVGAILTAGLTCALAHDLFVKPESYFAAPNARVTLPVLNGTFAESENSITPDRVLDFSVVAHGERSRPSMESWTAGDDDPTTTVTLETGKAGTYVVGISTRPRAIELSAEDFNGYLEHDGIPDVLEARRRDDELGNDAHERYAKHVKAILQVGDSRTDDFGEPLGYPAEIVPLANPYGLAEGSELALRCLVDGKPVSGQLVIAGGENAGTPFEERQARTDEAGEVRFAIDRPGRWYVKFIHMVAMGEESEFDYESKWATLTFEVR